MCQRQYFQNMALFKIYGLQLPELSAMILLVMEFWRLKKVSLKDAKVRESWHILRNLRKKSNLFLIMTGGGDERERKRDGTKLLTPVSVICNIHWRLPNYVIN